MAALTLYNDLPVAGTGHGRAFGEADEASGNSGSNVQAKGLIHTALLLEVLNDVAGTDGNFFALLEADIDLTGQFILVVVEDAGSTQHHGSMGIVAAGMHYAIHFRLEGNIGFLLNRQSIDITTEGNGLTGTAGVDQANYIGASHREFPSCPALRRCGRWSRLPGRTVPDDGGIRDADQ